MHTLLFGFFKGILHFYFPYESENHKQVDSVSVSLWLKNFSSFFPEWISPIICRLYRNEWKGLHYALYFRLDVWQNRNITNNPTVLNKSPLTSSISFSGKCLFWRGKLVPHLNRCSCPRACRRSEQSISTWAAFSPADVHWASHLFLRALKIQHPGRWESPAELRLQPVEIPPSRGGQYGGQAGLPRKGRKLAGERLWVSRVRIVVEFNLFQFYRWKELGDKWCELHDSVNVFKTT